MLISAALPAKAHAASAYLGDMAGNASISVDRNEVFEVVLWLEGAQDLAGFDCGIEVIGPAVTVGESCCGHWFTDARNVYVAADFDDYCSAMQFAPTEISGSGDLVVFTLLAGEDGIAVVRINAHRFLLAAKDYTRIAVPLPPVLYITVGAGGEAPDIEPLVAQMDEANEEAQDSRLLGMLDSESYILKVKSTPTTGAAITGDLPGTTCYVEEVEEQTVVDLTAPLTHDDRDFYEWVVNDVEQELGERDVTITMTGTTIAAADYNRKLTITSTPFVGVSITGTIAGQTPYSGQLEPRAQVELTAPASHNSRDFDRWIVNGETKTQGSSAVSFSLSNDTVAVASYNHSLSITSLPTGITVTVVVNSEAPAQIVTDDSIEVAAGDTVTVTAPVWCQDSCSIYWAFLCWCDGEGEPCYSYADNVFETTVGADTTIFAKYTSDVFWVDDDAAGPQYSGTHDDPCSTIQDGVDNCVDDERDYVVLVCPGTYTLYSEIVVGHVSESERFLIIRSEYPAEDEENRSSLEPGYGNNLAFDFTLGEPPETVVFGLYFDGVSIEVSPYIVEMELTPSCPTISHCLFESGSVDCTCSSPQIVSNTFLSGTITCTGSSPLIAANTFTGSRVNCTSYMDDDGFRFASSPTIASNTFTNSTARAISWFSELGDDGITPINADVWICQNTITDCSATLGGAIFLKYQPALLEDHTDQWVCVRNNIIDGNEAEKGGGIYVSGGDSSKFHLDMCGNTISGNHAASGARLGGGAYLLACRASLLDNQFVGNFAGNPLTLDQGCAGGIYVKGSLIDSMSGNVISGNTSYGHGGGIWLENVGDEGDPVLLHGNRIQDNTTIESGGGLYIQLSYVISRSDCMTGNQVLGHGGQNPGPAYGGAVYANWSDATFVNATFAENAAVAPTETVAAHGGAIFSKDSDLSVTNCIFWGNTAVDWLELPPGHDIYAHHFCNVVIEYSDVEGSLDEEWEDWITVSEDSTLAAEANQDADPMFISFPEYFAYSIAPWSRSTVSPCVDAGDNSVVDPCEKDIVGNPRCVDGINPDAQDGVVDQGAFEVPAEQSYIWRLQGDCNWDCVVNILDMLFVRDRIGLDPTIGSNWKADVNMDGNINILDLLVVRNLLTTTCD